MDGITNFSNDWQYIEQNNYRMDNRLALINKKNDGNVPQAFSWSPDLAPVVWQKTEQIYNKKV